jgi:hypothetical protein
MLSGKNARKNKEMITRSEEIEISTRQDRVRI